MRNLILTSFILFLITSCGNDSEEGSSQSSSLTIDAKELKKATSIRLITPSSPISAHTEPVIEIGGVEPQDMIMIYSDSFCSTLVANSKSIGPSVQIVIPTLQEGQYQFYAKRVNVESDLESACSDIFLEYTVQHVFITGMANDLTPSRSKNFSWGCTETLACEYRVAINNSPTHLFSNETYSETNTKLVSEGTGTFYIHLQARDINTPELESAVASYQFELDNTGPTVNITSSPAINSLNAENYTILGQCSEEGQNVVIKVEGIIKSSPCTNLSWSSTLNVSSLADGNIDIMVNQSDSLGNTGNQVNKQVIKDTVSPSVTTKNIADNTYELNNVINIAVQFSETVQVSEGVPRLHLNFESESAPPIYASYISGSGTSILNFHYTVASGDNDLNGIILADTLLLNGANIKDQNGNNANTQIGQTHFSNVFVNSDAPYITSFIEPADATYGKDGELLFQVNFSSPVQVTGSPRISINLDSSTVYADLKTGSGTSGLEFSYIVQEGDQDNDGITLGSSSILLNGGTIKAVSDNDDSALGFEVHLNDMSNVIINTESSLIAPDQVTGVTTAPTTNNQELGMTWNIPNSNGTDIINYTVQYRKQGTSTWLNLSPAPTQNEAKISGLIEGNTYEIRVAANNGLLGPFSPVSTTKIFDILSLNPVVWLSSTNVMNSEITPNHDDIIGTWEDLTGVSDPATETDPTKMPTYQTNVQNGLPALRFDNLDRGLQGTFSRSIGTDLTFVIVGQYDTGSHDKCFFEFRGGGNARGFFIDRRYAGNNMFSPTTIKGEFALWRIEDSSGFATVTENMTTQLYSGPTTFNTSFTGVGNYVLGDDTTGGNRLNGFIGEFIIFDRALTVEEINTLETYLKNKWGL